MENIQDFNKDILFGIKNEDKFIHWCAAKNMKYEDRRGVHDGIDFYTWHKNKKMGVDVKSQKWECCLCLEEWSNCNPDYGTVKKGWIDTSKADYFCWIHNLTMTWLSNSKSFKDWYFTNRENYRLIKNQSRKGGRMWESAFRSVPVDDIPAEFYQRKEIEC